MKAKPSTKTVADILRLHKANILAVDLEYQRGRVWTVPQKKYFIDSVLRGYHIPLIYLHFKPGTSIDGFAEGDKLPVIDGQ